MWKKGKEKMIEIKRNVATSMEEGVSIIERGGSFYNDKKFYVIELTPERTTSGRMRYRRGVVIGDHIFFAKQLSMAEVSRKNNEKGVYFPYCDGADRAWLEDDFNRKDMTVNLYNAFIDDFEDINIDKIYMVDGKDVIEFIFSDWEYDSDYDDEECVLVWDRNAKEETTEDKANKVVDDFLNKYGIDKEGFADFVEKMVDIIG